MGEMYARNHQLKRAQLYFDKVNDYLSKLPVEQQDEQYYLRVLMMVYYTAEFEMIRNNYTDSQRLIKAGVGLCSAQHVTFYLPDLKFLATQCAVALHQPAQKVQGLMELKRWLLVKINQK